MYYGTVYVDIVKTYETGENGWELLANGLPFDAVRWFKREAERYPEHGALEVGLALSLATTGKHNDAVHSMRRAFRVDPGSIPYILVDDRLAQVIGDIIGVYADDASNPDHAFMISSLLFLMRDLDEAYAAIEFSIDKSGHRASADNLLEVIKREFGDRDRTQFLQPSTRSAPAP